MIVEMNAAYLIIERVTSVLHNKKHILIKFVLSIHYRKKKEQNEKKKDRERERGGTTNIKKRSKMEEMMI
jgi:hypothetical protein